MAQPVDPAFRDRLQALRDKYVASVPGRMAEIAAALARCREHGRGPEHLAALHHSLHTVAGSAGSFGLGALGGEARRIEQLLRQFMAGQGDWATIDAATQTLLQWAHNNCCAPHFAPHD